VVWGNKLFVTSAVSDKEMKPKNFAGGVRTPQSMGMGFMSKAPDVEIEWTLFCLNASTGEILWKKVVDQGKPQYAVHPSNSYATETPVVNENTVIAYFGATGEMAAIDHAGNGLWQRNFGAQKTNNSFGTGSSLAIYEDQVFLQNFSESTADLHALNIRTGQTNWKQSRDKNGTSWSSPILWKNDLRTELVVSGGSQVEAFDPASGQSIWTLKNVKAATACSLCWDSKHIYFGGSDPFSKGPLFAVRAGGSGDISPAKKNGEFELCAWQAKKSAPGMSSPACGDSSVVVVDKNILRAYDRDTGDRIHQSRVKDLTMVNASPIMIGKNLLLIDEAGNCAVVDTESFETIATGQLNDTVWATPAVSSTGIYIRGVEALYCIAGTP
jgi:outer membrane protein assembly factor BamB